MRIFLAGDALTGTGPANVTKYYIENLPEGTLFLRHRNKLIRVFEILIYTLRADVVVYSGHSKQNILGLRLAKVFRRPSAFIMHGCVEYENEINCEVDESMTAVERRTLELADEIFAVSTWFENWLKDRYPMYAGKIDHVTNGIDLAVSAGESEERDRHMIFSIGGGMPRKKIKHICEAVKILREEYDPELKLVVAGADGADTDKINGYDLTDNRGIISHNEVCELFKKASLFVQNSCFETFGLAPVEALANGCSLMCSKHVGALDLIKGITDADVIQEYDDPHEIASKIRIILEEPNAKRLADSVEWELDSWKERSALLCAKLSKLIQTR